MLQGIITQLGINQTLWAQLLIFSVLYVALRFLFFGPYLRLIELREKESTGTEKQSAEMNQESGRLEAERAEKVAAAKKLARERREQIIAKARGAASSKISAARGSAKEKIERSRNELNSSDEGSNTAESQANAVAEIFVEKLLSAKVSL